MHRRSEEFTIVLAPPVEHDDALAICDRLRRAVQQTTLLIGGLDGKLKASTIRRVSEVVEAHPEESLAILRTWMHER